MIIASLSENKNKEKRIAVTPEIAKKYISSGFDVCISKDYGKHLGFFDDEYKTLGVKVLDSDVDVITSADILVQLELPSDDRLEKLKFDNSRDDHVIHLGLTL